MRTTLLIALLTCLAAPAQKKPVFNDGEMHGDAPYLVEDGWMPLINGHDLSGWTGRDGKPHNWITTKAVWWDRLLSPKFFGAIAEPGDRILNGVGGVRAADL